MSSKIVLFGATGYTGRLVAEALVDRKLQPMLCARNKEKLDHLSRQLGHLQTAVADAKSVSALAGLLSKGDVLISTVGPFVKYGRTAVAAAIEKGAVYIDSTGEPDFIQTVFEHYGPRARIMKNAAAVQSVLLKVPGYRPLAEGLLSLLPASRGKGPDALQRKAQTSHIIAETFDHRGERISRVDMEGVDGYTFTARFMAWAAHRLYAQGISQPGASGPIDMFGADQLRAGCEQSGLTATMGEGSAA
jgi:short subunit dehydrogenase-like uncharacterized protein